MTDKLSKMVAGALLLFLLATPALAAEGLILKDSVPADVARLNLQPAGRLPADNRLYLVIGLPLHNEEALGILLQQLYDPASPNFHRYLTPEQFSKKFGPTETEYQAVLQFAKTNGLTVVNTYSHRQLVDVSATVANIEKAFHIHLRTYHHPRENRQFYAPDVEPSVDAGVPIQTVSGLNNYVLGRTGLRRKSVTEGSPVPNSNGTGSGGALWGYDFRNAYAPGVMLMGAGQNVGLVEMDGYYLSDITNYEAASGLPQVIPQNVLLPGSAGYPTTNANVVSECSLDIEMVIAMAPGLAKLYVFEGTNFDDVLASMVTNTQIKQFSSSYSGYGFDSSGDNLLKEMATQGQTFFESSGDGDAYTQPVSAPSDSTNVISCGGTVVIMDPTSTYFVSEVVWNSGYQSTAWGGNGGYTVGTNTNGGAWGSGGGVSSNYSIPSWQQPLNLTAVGGSSTKRNIPDVALTGDNVEAYYFNGKIAIFEGTSIAAPLWAGFTALINEQAANHGYPSVGFLNPAFYVIGQSANYNTNFHDTTVSNNFWPGSPSHFAATTGYDLCTGWGTPNGQTLIDTLAYYGQIWVNFSASSCPGNGSYADPFCTLASATNAVPTGGTIYFMGPNSSGVTPTISKPMTLRAFYGPVTIGN